MALLRVTLHISAKHWIRKTLSSKKTISFVIIYIIGIVIILLLFFYYYRYSFFSPKLMYNFWYFPSAMFLLLIVKHRAYYVMLELGVVGHRIGPSDARSYNNCCRKTDTGINFFWRLGRKTASLSWHALLPFESVWAMLPALWIGGVSAWSLGAVSSDGRASRLHRGCRRFDPVTAHQIPINLW